MRHRATKEFEHQLQTEKNVEQCSNMQRKKHSHDHGTQPTMALIGNYVKSKTVTIS